VWGWAEVRKARWYSSQEGSPVRRSVDLQVGVRYRSARVGWCVSIALVVAGIVLMSTLVGAALLPFLVSYVLWLAG
jgi:hypothetical protein